MICIFTMERWLRGRKHLTANEAGDKTPRGFESLLLRIIFKRPIYGSFKIYK